MPENCGQFYTYSPHQISQSIFPCPRCPKIYKTKESLYMHRKFECGKEPQFKCPFCPHKTHLKGNMKKHCRSKHGVEDLNNLSSFHHPVQDNYKFTHLI